MTDDPFVRDLEQAARIGFREEGRGCILVVHGFDGTSSMQYASLRRIEADPLPGANDELIGALKSYDIASEYVVIEYAEEADGTALPTWYRLLYRGGKPTLTA